MKLQCGILCHDGRSASGLDLATVLGEFNGWNAETSGEFVDGPLAMIYRGDRVTIEEDNEVQPVRCGPYRMTWDGRLDNRNEIAARIGLRSTVALSDADLVARAYAEAGQSLFGDLIGEFALVVWQEGTRDLTLARSVCGSRTLYYMVDEEKLVWSSHFAHLVRAIGMDLAINETYILEYLFGQPTALHSPLEHVAVVPPGRVVVQKHGTLPVSSPFWDWEHVKPVRYTCEWEYEEHFRQLMTEAVSVRLRTPGTFFAEMSGGFDSSSVLLIADQVLRSRGVDVGRQKTISCIYEESESCDESRFIQAIERWRGVPTLYVQEYEQQATLGLSDIEFTGIPNPLHAFPGRYRVFGTRVREHGARVLLTGQGGDHLFWSHCDGSPLVADELLRARFLKAHRECRRWSQVAGIPYLRLLLGMAFPLAFDLLGLKRRDYFEPLVPGWLEEKHKRQLASIVHDSVSRTFGGHTPSERTQRRIAEDLFSISAAGFYAEYSDLYISHVYTHLPLVQFCVSIPLSQFVRHGETRSLMRRALKDVLPPELLKRRGKQPLDEAVMRAVAREWKDVGDVRQWRLCQRGFAVALLLKKALDRARLGAERPEDQILRVITMERWLRSLECLRSRAAEPITSHDGGENVSMSAVS